MSADDYAETPEEEKEEDIKTDSVIIDEFKNYLSKTQYEQISQLLYRENPVVTIDYDAIATEDISTHFHDNIDNAIDCLKQAVSQILSDIDPMVVATPEIRIKNYDIATPLRNLSSKDSKTLKVINCVVAKVSAEKPFLIKAVFECQSCGNKLSSKTIQAKCPACEEKNMMKLSLEDSKFTSHRILTIQELPEDIPAGQIPVSKNVTVTGHDLTHSDICRAANRIKLTAFVRLDYDKDTVEKLGDKNDPLGIYANVDNLMGTTFILNLDANNIEPLSESDDSNRLNTSIAITKEDIEYMESLKTKPNLYNTLIASFAPHIYGHDVIKEALLLSLVGAHVKTTSFVKKRGDINILMVGNAGTAKSQLLLFSAKLSPRSIYVSGRGASNVGLTASVNRDEKTGQMMLEAGACVLGDKGNVIVDEFDKLKPEDRSGLHEVMEQQTVSVAKGGIVATLNARVSILAAANPLTGTYNSYKTLAENTGYPPSMISRFDCIFVIKDIVDAQRDSEIAKLMLAKDPYILKDRTEHNFQLLDPIRLAKYIHYVRKIMPNSESIMITPEADQEINNIYVNLRQRSEVDKDGTTAAITVTARIVDNLNRMAVARAKLLQKEAADIEDVRRAFFIMCKMYESFGVMIPNSEEPDLAKAVKEMPTINLGVLYGKPISKRSRQSVFVEICDNITMGNDANKLIDVGVLQDELKKTRKFPTDFEIQDTIQRAIKAGVLSHQKGNVYRYDKDVINSL